MRLEYIVRPFQSFPVTPPQRVIDPTSPDVPNLVLAFGFEGQVKTLNGSFNSTINGYTDDHHKELSRETSIKKITNPDDSSQSLDVELINKLTTEKGTGVNYKKSTYDLKNT
jgi:hypothetical protein